MADAAPTIQPGTIDFGDPNFVPEATGYSGGGDFIRMFRMSKSWPQKPFEDRKFQLGGIERAAFLEETTFMCWAHRFSVQWMGSTVNGTRRCTLDSRGSCVACQHYEAAPTVVKDGKNKKDARCGKRQQLFGCNLLVYKSDLEGNLLDEQNQRITLDTDKGPIIPDGSPADLVYEVYLWRFNAEKFNDVKQIKKDWQTLLKNDITLQLAPGKDEKFQDFSPNISPVSAWRLLAIQDKARAEAVVEYYKENKYDVERILGKEYTDDEMLGFLGLGPGGARAQQAAAEPTAQVAQRVEEELAALNQASEQAAATPEPPKEETPAQTEEQPQSFDSLLNQI